LFGAGRPSPAKPKSFFFTTVATITAISREIAYASLPPLSYKQIVLRTPPLGPMLLVIANLIFLIVLCFYGLDPRDQWQRENIGYRTGFITICQLPLLFLLSGRKNIVGMLTGFGYERLNWLHRWAARCLLFTATIHMGYWFADWAPYNYISVKVTTDPITKHGVIAWSLLVWIVVSSMAPIRGWNYEFFVVQHLLSFAAFVTMVYIHTPAEVHVWIWIPVGLFVFDRLVRAASVLYNSLSIFHPRHRARGLWACTATLTPLSHNTTRITIANPPIKWAAGQHVFLSCHSIVPLQSHPFTIASLPCDGKMEFIIQSKKGGTRRFFSHAERFHTALPVFTTDGSITKGKGVAIEGPYGRIRPLHQFDSVVFLAGSTGATFTLPLMRDIVSSWYESHLCGMPFGRLQLVTRNIRFVWVVKSLGQLSWFSDQLSHVALDLERWRSAFGGWAQVEMSVYMTCDESLTAVEPTSCPPPIVSPIALPKASHGQVEEMPSGQLSNEKASLKEKGDDLSIRSFSSTSTNESEPRGTCGPDGTCCCTSTVNDEDAISTIVCTCNCTPSESSLPSHDVSPANVKSSLQDTPKPTPSLHPSITVLAGRPNPRNIIRKTLEQALGESAVVVCGPRGLVDDVRRSVVGLSDERAVHKGTGAQGIYLHTEAFGY